jgi:hypothetical protein
MGKFLTTLFELVVPFFIIFFVLPKVWNVLFDKDDDEFEKRIKKMKKKKRKPDDMRMVGDRVYRDIVRPSKPKGPIDILNERRKLADTLKKYEVRDGRIVKKRSNEYEEMWETGSTKVKEEPHKPQKKKSFSKGVDPDFL